MANNADGVQWALNTPTAHIGQHSAMEYLARQKCRLTTLPDDSAFNDIQYGIALQKGSKWLAPFNEAIRQLKEGGKLAELKAKYWTGPCSV